MSAYDELKTFQFRLGKGYDRRSVEEYRATVLNAVDELLRQIVLLNEESSVRGPEPTPHLSPDEIHVLQLFRSLSSHERTAVMAHGLKHSAASIDPRPLTSAAQGPSIREPSWAANLETDGWPISIAATTNTWAQTAPAFTPAAPAFAPAETAGRVDWFSTHAAEPTPPPSIDPDWFGRQVSAPVAGEVVPFPARPVPLPSTNDAHLDSLFDQLDFGRPPADVFMATDLVFAPSATAPLAIRPIPANAARLPEPVQPWTGWVS